MENIELVTEVEVNGWYKIVDVKGPKESWWWKRKSNEEDVVEKGKTFRANGCAIT